MNGVKEDYMKKVGLVLVGIVVLTIGILSIPREEKQVLIEEKEDTTNTSLAFYIEKEEGGYEETSSLPQTGYTLNTERSICTNNATPVWKDNKLYLNNLEADGTTCYMYFNIYEPNAGEQILENYPTQLTRNDFSVTVTDTTTGTIYYADTSKGRTYYFAGNPTDNWVRFGGFYWRIIRINEDGSIRMIYQGTSANTTSSDTQIGTSAFNTSYNDNAYVGYMYEINQVHGLTSDSTIKGVLDAWYQNNLASYAGYLDGNAGFCGDRTSYTNTSGSSGGGTGTSTTYYGAYIRLITNKAPTFECENDSNLYTTSGSEDGNGALSYPIGLISSDEVAYAGGLYNTTNEDYYLYTGQNYWTMSPYNFNRDFAYACIFLVDSAGWLTSDGGVYLVTNPFGVRPVINLKADITLAGSGTSSDPYTVEGAA